MKLDVATTPDLGWIIDRTGCALTSSARGIKAVDDAGRIKGMVAYDGWTPNSVQAHMAVDTPIAWRKLLPACFSVPFDECDRSWLFAMVAGDNERSLNLVRQFGFTESRRVPHGWARGVDLHLFQMHRDECRYLQQKAA